MFRYFSILLLFYLGSIASAYAGNSIIDTDRLIEGEARDAIAQIFTPGLYSITWFEPVMTPRLKIEKRVLNRCYTAQDAENGVNIVLPEKQQSSCKSLTTMMHDDIMFNTDCSNKAFQQLRVSLCDGRLCGTYRYSDKDNDRIYEASVFIDKISDNCR